MTDTTADTHLNGTAPATPPAPAEGCEDCVTGGEKLMAVFTIIIAIGLIVLAADGWTGGKVLGMAREAVASGD
jgi:hypothetical protein